MNKTFPHDDEDFLEPLRRSPRAEAPPFLFTRIEARLRANLTQAQIVPPRKLAWFSAAAALLVLLNVAAWRHISHRPGAAPAPAGILGNPALDAYSTSS